MIKSIHIKLLLLFSLSTLFGHSAFAQVDINNNVPTEQHICADTTITYTSFGFPGSTIGWYIDGTHLSTKDVVVPDIPIAPPTSGSNVVFEGFTYNKAVLSHIWTLSGANTLENHTLKIQEVSADAAACSTGVLNPGLLVHVHKKPSSPIVTVNPIVCNGQQGSLSVDLSGVAIPTGLVLQIRLLKSDDSIDVNWGNVNTPIHLFAGLDAGSYKTEFRYTVGGDHVIGSIVTGGINTLTNPATLALSKSITKVTCVGGVDGAIDLTLTGGDRNALRFDGTDGVARCGQYITHAKSAFTLEGWVHLDATHNYNTGIFSLFGENGTIELYIAAGQIEGHTGSAHIIRYPIAGLIDDDKWHHLAFTGDGSNIHIYVDGYLKQTEPGVVSTNGYGVCPSGSYFRIGAGVRSGGTTEAFTGDIAQVRFWGTDRTQSQLLAGMTQVMIGSETGLITDYSLNEGNGTTLTGVGSNAISGNISGGANWITNASLYRYEWTKQGDAGFLKTSQNLSNLSSGIYEVAVSSASGCTISDNNIVVGVNPDNTDPVFAAAPANVTIDCIDAVPAMTDLAWTDNCDASGTVTGSDAVIVGTDCNGAITRTWSYTDGGGNTATATQTITVLDNVKPTASNPADINIECIGSLPAPNVAVVTDEADNCTANPVVAFVSDSDDGLSNPKTITRTYSVTDACSNTISLTQDIIIKDNSNPDIPTLADVTGECDATVSVPTTTDNCSGSITGTTSDPLTYSTQGTHTITWNFDDGNGNAIDVPQTVIVDDTTDPVLADLADLAIIDCAEDESVSPQVKSFTGLDLQSTRYTDNCSSIFIIEYRILLPDNSFANVFGVQASGAISSSDPSGFNFPLGVSTIHVRVLDTSGNISNVETYTVTINHKPNPSEIDF